MPSEIELLRNRIRSIDLPNEVPNILESDSAEISELVQLQLKKGELSTGAKITPKYKSDYYARKKYEQNSAPGLGTPDIYRTGAFYRGMGVIADRNEYIIDSNVVRNRLAQYGSQLLELNDTNKTRYIKGTLTKRIKEYIISKAGNVFD